MAATVVDSTRSDHPVGVQGLIPFSHQVAIATTSIDEAGDDVLLFKFPPNSFIKANDLDVEFDDLDTNGTPTLVVDIGVGDSDGVIDTVIINNSTGPQTGADDVADASTAGNYWVDCSDKYLIMTVVTAAATAAAGDVTVRGTYAVGLVEAVTS